MNVTVTIEDTIVVEGGSVVDVVEDELDVSDELELVVIAGGGVLASCSSCWWLELCLDMMITEATPPLMAMRRRAARAIEM